MKTTDQDQATDNAQTADQVPLDWWLVPALFMAGNYAEVMARINGWGDDRQREYMSELARDIRADVASGDLPTRSARTRRKNKPGPDAYEGGLLDLQDFCDWAARTGLQGCPDSADVLACALDLPLTARAMAITPAMDAHQAKISAPAVAHPKPVAAPVEVEPEECEDAAATLLNSLPKSRWKELHSNRWTKAAKDQMRAMRDKYTDLQIAEAFALNRARQVGNLIGSRSANKAARKDHRKIIDGCIESSTVIGSASGHRLT